MHHQGVRRLFLLAASCGLMAVTMPECDINKIKPIDFSLVNSGTIAKVEERGFVCVETPSQYLSNVVFESPQSVFEHRICHSTRNPASPDAAMLVQGVQVMKMCMVEAIQNSEICKTLSSESSIPEAFAKSYCDIASSVTPDSTALTALRRDIAGLTVGGPINYCDVPQSLLDPGADTGTNPGN